jgi:pyruvate dehydrogenase E2 component (dihydrolipoamide acetyltransferase)
VPDAPTPSPSDAAPATGAKGAVSVQELTRPQEAHARRAAEAKAIVPEFTVEVDVDMEGVVALREQLAGADAPTVNDVVVKAVALALREHPRVNGAYRDGRFELHERVNVGIVVAGPDQLVVPTVYDADAKSLAEIAAATRAAIGRVRDGSITSAEQSGGTFTVSNLGMHGVDRFQAIVQAPQAAVLAVGAIAKRAVVRDDELVARRTLTLTLACDHRILYGADAAAFAARVRGLLEAPLGLVG